MSCDKNTIFITGATGLLGSKLVDNILNETDYDILMYLRDTKDVDACLKRFDKKSVQRVHTVKSDKMSADLIDGSNVTCAVHLAFSRRNRPYSEMASSVDFCGKIFKILSISKVKRVIYISSQGVYGNTQEFRKESTICAPATIYSMAKYAGEKLFEAYFEGTGIENVIVRLEGIIQSQNLVKALCKQVKQMNKISLKGGMQTFSYLDVDDAADAFLALIQHKQQCAPVYNIGPDHMRKNLIEIAEIVAETGEKLGYGSTDIVLEHQDIEMNAGMDAGLFANDIGWKPKYNIEQMVERVFKSIGE